MLCLGWMFLQDIKERKVYWFLFPILAFILLAIYYLIIPIWQVVISNIALNLSIVSLVVVTAYFYTRLVRKKKFLNHSLGAGDVLLFMAFALGFPSITFIILLAFSLVFSLVLFLILKSSLKDQTVPLAGLISLFLVFTVLTFA